jgi:integrase
LVAAHGSLYFLEENLMTIRKREWLGGAAFVADLGVLHGERHRRQFPTRAEAKAYEHEVITRARAGTWRAGGAKMTVADLVPNYSSFLEDKVMLGTMAKTTMVHRLAQIEHYVTAGATFHARGFARVFKDGIGHVRLADLDQEAVETWLRAVAKVGCTAGTLWEIKGALSGLLEFAKKQKYIAVNPARTLSRADFPGRPNQKVQPPSRELVQRMIAAANPWLALRIKFAVLTGLRIGEQLALRWRDVDLVKGLVCVTKAVGHYNGEGKPKTDAGCRSVPISASLILELKASQKSAGPDDFVFPSVKGVQCAAGSLTIAFHRHYEKVMKTWPPESAKPPRPRWHSLRHFAVSCWIAAGLSPKAIQIYVGHTDFKMTMSVYGHLLFPPEQDGAAMELIANDLFNAPKQAAA